MIHSVIVDSSALVSLATVTDSNYFKAVEISTSMQKTNAHLIIPGDVFAETINTLGKKSSHQLAVGTAEMILGSEVFMVMEADDEMRVSALKLFKGSANSVSYTDCLVMAFADAYKTKFIFGFDEIFRKNGYRLPG